MAPKTQQQVIDTLTASTSLDLMPMSTHGSGKISQEISVRWKTFLYRAIYGHLKADGKSILCVASSGIIKVHCIVYVLEVVNRKCSHPPRHPSYHKTNCRHKLDYTG
jgi:hypothetical protein